MRDDESEQLQSGRLGCLPDHGEWLYASAANVSAATFAIAAATRATTATLAVATATRTTSTSPAIAGWLHVGNRLGIAVLLVHKQWRLCHRWHRQSCKQRALHDSRQPGALRNGNVLRDGELLR